MTVYVVLDATHYPVAIFFDLDKANAYAATRPPCYVVRSKLSDEIAA